jgi:hypothetical protein
MKKIAVFALLIISSFFISTGFVYANQDRPEKIVTLDENEIIEGDYFAAGDIVEVYGTIQGDAYIAGGQVIIDGNIEGDLLVAGGTITINGSIAQDVRAAGGQINIDSSIGKNATILGGNIDISGEELPGNLVLGVGSANLNSPISGNIKGAAGNVNISNAVGGNIELATGTLRLSPQASVGGNLTYWSEEEAMISDSATVSGTVTMQKVPNNMTEVDYQSEQKIKDTFKSLGYVARFISVLSAFIVGVLLTALYPNYLKKVSTTLKDSPWKSLGVGFAALVLTPIAFIILLTTVIGIPLGLILLAFYFIYLYLAKVAVSFWAGSIIIKKANITFKNWYALAIGLIAYLLLTIIPVVKGFVSFATVLFGLGAMLLACKEIYSEQK